MKTIIIAGGSGFLGQVLESYFSQNGYEVKLLTRNPQKDNHIAWDGEHLGLWTLQLESAYALINLSGKSVNCRYNKRNKKRIYSSRIDSTNLLGLAINLCDNPPAVWVNASTATIYRHSLDKEMDETTGETGNDFSMNIARSWEKAFFDITNPKTRKIAIRTAIVLGKRGGALIPLKRLVRFGMGGKQGNGDQKVSWMHEQDFARAVEFLLASGLDGVFNLTVPKPINNKQLMKTLRQAMNIPIGIPQHKCLLTLGAMIIGTETELILKSRNVIPERLMKHGFTFQYPTIKTALKQLVS